MAASSTEPANGNPFHAGEIQLQQSVGVAARMAEFGQRVVRHFMPDQHRDFYQQLPFVVLGATDADGNVWATLMTGQPGFVTSPDPRHLRIWGPRDPLDPALAALSHASAVGLLGIELHTRRRNRMNGTIVQLCGEHLDVEVEHAFGNCPQYIQQRDLALVAPADAASSARAVETGVEFNARVRAIISAADTFFVSSYMTDEQGRRHVDASHRGGKPGFIRHNADGGLTVPDFAGNLHFNSLGNFLLNRRAGLVFPDFVSGDLLHVTGTVDVVTRSDEIAAFQGAERLWRFVPARWVLRPGALPLRGAIRADGWSPNCLMTGDWQSAAARMAAESRRNEWRRLVVSKIVNESAIIRSFHLTALSDENVAGVVVVAAAAAAAAAAAEAEGGGGGGGGDTAGRGGGGGLIVHAAGQHLPIRITIPADNAASERLRRSYTISSAPSDGLYYRISVKREGRVSQWLHDHIAVGDIVEARAPSGSFTVDALNRQQPAVLLAAGVGITPMIAMLRHIVFEGLRKRGIRRTFLFQSARTKSQRAFDREIADLVAKSNGAVSWIRVLSDVAGAEVGLDYDVHGRINADLLCQKLPFGAPEFFLCGPAAFMQALHDQLRALDVPERRIHAEAFGPSAIVRESAETDVEASRGSGVALKPVATAPVPVGFSASGKEARWLPGSGSLLELAESRGLEPPFGCRGGSCGSCATRIVAGEVSYLKAPSAKVGAGVALVCCAVPAAGQDRLVLDF